MVLIYKIGRHLKKLKDMYAYNYMRLYISLSYLLLCDGRLYPGSLLPDHAHISFQCDRRPCQTYQHSPREE